MPESTTPESYKILRRSIGVLLALGTLAAGNLELRGSNKKQLHAVQAANVVSVGSCLLNTPVSVLCPHTDSTVNTTTTLKTPVTTTTSTTPPKEAVIMTEASKGLQNATTSEIKYLGCISLRESADNPKSYNAAGPYYGKYQFLQSTWNGFVLKIGLDPLIDTEIREVEESTQDYIALQFLRHGRNGEWGPNRQCNHQLLEI